MMRTSQKSPQRRRVRCSDLPPCKPMAHALARAARSMQGTIRAQKGERTTRRAGNDAKGVGAKFRSGVARSEQWVVLNFDLTPFASDPICF